MIDWLINWLIHSLLFNFPLKNISLTWGRNHYRRRAAKFRSMLGTQGLWAQRDHYCATPAVARGLGFPISSGKTAPFSRLLRHRGMWRIYLNPDPHGSSFGRPLRHTGGCGGPILTQVLSDKWDLSCISWHVDGSSTVRMGLVNFLEIS
jgi:hypothetical protein